MHLSIKARDTLVLVFNTRRPELNNKGSFLAKIVRKLDMFSHLECLWLG